MVGRSSAAWRHPVPALFRQSREDSEKRPTTISSLLPARGRDYEHVCCSHVATSDNTQIYEDSSAVPRGVLDQAVTDRYLTVIHGQAATSADLPTPQWRQEQWVGLALATLIFPQGRRSV
jgi:hypothetical protein